MPSLEKAVIGAERKPKHADEFNPTAPALGTLAAPRAGLWPRAGLHNAPYASSIHRSPRLKFHIVRQEVISDN